MMRLLMPEWQGYGLHADAHAGAMALAGATFGTSPDVLVIDAPAKERLQVDDGVLGLHSIAPRLIQATAAIALAAPERIRMIGGTCGVDVAPVAYLNARHNGDLAVLWVDAHADLNTPATSPSSHFHGMALRALLGEGPAVMTRTIAGPLRPEQVFLVGVRDLDPPEAAYVISHALAGFDDAVFEDPAPLVAAIAARRFSRIHVHFDVDVLDPVRFDGSLMRVPGGGPSLDAVIGLIGTLAAAFDLTGLSVLEYCERDPALTRTLAAAIAPFMK
jgi:arginase